MSNATINTGTDTDSASRGFMCQVPGLGTPRQGVRFPEQLPPNRIPPETRSVGLTSSIMILPTDRIKEGELNHRNRNSHSSRREVTFHAIKCVEKSNVGGVVPVIPVDCLLAQLLLELEASPSGPPLQLRKWTVLCGCEG